jgi:hypothetical protein
MDKNVIIVDLDDTAFPLMDLFVKVARDELGIDVDPLYREWHAIGLDFENLEHLKQTFIRCYDPELMLDIPPYEGCVEALQHLHDMGFEIRYFTDRTQTAKQATIDWLTKYNFPNIEGLTICEDKRTDIENLDDRERILTIIDDRPRTLVWARYIIGLEHVFSLSHTYNENLSDIPGITLRKTWEELLPEVESFVASRIGTRT